MLEKGSLLVLGKVPLSLEDDAVPFSHLEQESGSLIGSPASRPSKRVVLLNTDRVM